MIGIMLVIGGGTFLYQVKLKSIILEQEDQDLKKVLINGAIVVGLYIAVYSHSVSEFGRYDDFAVVYAVYLTTCLILAYNLFWMHKKIFSPIKKSANDRIYQETETLNKAQEDFKKRVNELERQKQDAKIEITRFKKAKDSLDKQIGQDFKKLKKYVGKYGFVVPVV